MSHLIFISDFFLQDVMGGAEATDEVLISLLKKQNHIIDKKRSRTVTPSFIKENEKAVFIVSNFVHLGEAAKNALKDTTYIVYEHDHKYLKSRNPSIYKDYIAPLRVVCNKDFYQNAVAVVGQSKLHAKVIQQNLLINNIVNAGTSLWNPDDLELLATATTQPKIKKRAILESQNPIKGTAQAISYCTSKNLEYELLPSMPYEDFIKALAEFEEIVFFPQTLESFCRVIVEARMLNCKVVTNDLNGCVSEDWFSAKKGTELINYLTAASRTVVSLFDNLIKGKKTSFLPPLEIPKISLVTSMYDGDKYIESFLENITSQTIFDKCELIIVDANSPGNEKPIIDQYIEKFPSNIKYIRLEKDPGIYGAWNIGIETASGELITNANLDDRRSEFHLESHARQLLLNSHVDLVYSRCYMTNQEGESFQNNSSQGRTYPTEEFSKEGLVKCLPGCMPLWRKSIHKKFGLFDSNYKFAADWEMWLRAARGGSVFKKLDGVYGLYYYNPRGLSTDSARKNIKFKEEKEIFWEYLDVFGEDNVEKFAGYFSQEEI